MEFNNIERKAADLTDTEEEKLLKEISTVYGVTYKKSKTILSEFVANNNKQGKIDTMSANKYSRNTKLFDDIWLGIKFANTEVDGMITKHLNDVYKTNYYYTAYGIEGVTGTTVANQTINNDILGKALQSPLDKIALENNVAMVKANIKRDLTIGIQQQMTVTELSELVKKSLETNKNNAIRIAQTEQTRVMNKARFDVAEKSKAKGESVYKVWDARLDRKTRRTHARLDGEAIPLDRKFSNGLMYPADPNGTAKETINCRCNLTFIVGDGQVNKDFADYETWFNKIKENSK